MQQMQDIFEATVYPKTKFDYKEVQIQLMNHFMHGLLTRKGKDMLDNIIKESFRKNQKITNSIFCHFLIQSINQLKAMNLKFNILFGVQVVLAINFVFGQSRAGDPVTLTLEECLNYAFENS